MAASCARTTGGASTVTGRASRSRPTSPGCRFPAAPGSRPSPSPSATGWCGWVGAAVGDPAHDLPFLPEAEADDYVLIHELMEEWSASAPRIIDNALDVSHVAWVHRNSVGSSANPRLSDFTVEREGHVLRFSVSYVAAV